MNTLPSAAFVTSNESDGAIQHRVPDAATALSARATGINAVDSSPTTDTISDVHTNLVMSFGPPRSLTYRSFVSLAHLTCQRKRVTDCITSTFCRFPVGSLSASRRFHICPHP